MLAAASNAQTPDVLNSLDAGARAMGAGGAFYTAGADTLSSYNNPAGLAFIGAPQIGIAFRTLPSALTRLTGDFFNPDKQTRTSPGNRSLSHLGYAAPLGRSGRTYGSAFGVSFTTGGFFRERKGGGDLTYGDLQAQTYDETTQIKNDFINFGFAKATSTGMSFGVSLVIAQSGVLNRRELTLVDSDGNTRGTERADNSTTGTGIGASVGVQFSPITSNTSIGLSLRSPIELSGNATTQDIYDRIPGRLSFGIAHRIDAVRGGSDYILIGAQADAFYGTKKNATLNRKDTFAVGAGIEYGLNISGARLPIRFGFNTSQAGGSDFTDRNTFTFGLGYRPNSNQFSVDLNAASSSGGRYDLALALNYRLGR